MSVKMKMQAMSCASEAVDIYDILDCKSLLSTSKNKVS
ncbi:hypothetical protein LINGRAHAP2_LOCUS7365 [Linum grandiflorum]